MNKKCWPGVLSCVSAPVALAWARDPTAGEEVMCHLLTYPFASFQSLSTINNHQSVSLPSVFSCQSSLHYYYCHAFSKSWIGFLFSSSNGFTLLHSNIRISWHGSDPPFRPSFLPRMFCAEGPAPPCGSAHTSCRAPHLPAVSLLSASILSFAGQSSLSVHLKQAQP